ncbi:MAG: response regulator [Nitrosopumilus sp.]|nr:response regulator [Nitrosopumilus sp.]
MRILIIDNDLETTKMLSKYFLAKSILTVVFNDPLKGLRAIQQEKYDVILLDISMPQFSGMDIIQTLEKDNILQNQNILIFSGTLNYPNEINDLLKKEGIKGYLKKPIELDEILKTIAKELNLQKTPTTETIQT